MTSLDSDAPIQPHDFQADLDATARIDIIPKILDVICRTTGMGFAAVARVTDQRWIACQVLDHIAFGLKPGSELNVETTICDSIQQTRKAVVIDHVAQDPVYSTHHTPALYGFQSYISVPIIRGDGRLFGTLCAIDPRPARLQNPETIGMFTLFAELIATHLDNSEGLIVSQAHLQTSQADLKASQAALLEEQHVSELREQFIAVLGHDLRNPLASIAGAARLLGREPPADRGEMLLAAIQASVVRMSEMIDNVMDFARGRLGAGIPLDERPDVMLAPVLQGVVDELRLSAPDRSIEADFDLPDPVKCDPSRIAQLVSNLLANALTYGAPEKPVRVHANSRNAALTIWVANGGSPILDAARKRLFQPFFRGDVRPNQKGLGLGLHIASEIAKAHGGALSASSTPQETRFTFQACAVAP